jgi:serine/threonine protein kinase
VSTRHWAVDVTPGYRVGAWQVEEGIATGGWGSVYGARLVSSAPAAGDRGPLPDVAALKFLPTGTVTPRQLGHLADMAHRELLLRERLEHPRLIRTFQALTVDDPAHPELDGSVVLVMERAAGSLGDLLRRHDGPVADGPRLLEQVCEGLAHMHAAGWVHGDLKPNNVLIMADGTARLADFGLAAELDGTHAYLPPAGSPDYLPPERWSEPLSVQGTAVRTTADIWAFGVTAHQVLSGRWPFPGSTPSARVAAAAEYAAGAAPLRLHPGLPAGWREIIEDCLAPDHERRRHHDAATVLRRVRLAGAAPETGGNRTATEPAAPRRRRRVATAGIVLAALGLSAAGAVAVITGLYPSGDDAPTTSTSQEYRPDLLRTGVGIPPQYRKMIIDAGTGCRERGVSPVLIAAMLKAESNFNPHLSDPAKDEYGIARWTPRVLRFHLPDGQRDEVPKPPLTPEISIPAVGRYLCYLAPRITQTLPGERALLLAAAYRTSSETVNRAGGVRPAQRSYVRRVQEYMKLYTPVR